MKRKQFNVKTKIKYINLVKQKGFETALINFICEFEERYSNLYTLKGKKKINANPVRYGTSMLKK